MNEVSFLVFRLEAVILDFQVLKMSFDVSFKNIAIGSFSGKFSGDLCSFIPLPTNAISSRI